MSAIFARRFTRRTVRGAGAVAWSLLLCWGCSPKGAAEDASRTGAQAPSVEAGRALYVSTGCAVCHGPTGSGDGPVGRTLTPAPLDFRSPAAFATGRDEATIAQTIAIGVPNGGAMPMYPNLSETDRRSIALFLLSLHAPTSPVVAPAP